MRGIRQYLSPNWLKIPHIWLRSIFKITTTLILYSYCSLLARKISKIFIEGILGTKDLSSDFGHFFQKWPHTTSSHLWWPPGRHISIICKKSTSHFLFVKVSLFGDSIFTGQQWKNIRALITELIQCRICLSLCQLFFSNFYFFITF